MVIGDTLYQLALQALEQVNGKLAYKKDSWFWKRLGPRATTTWRKTIWLPDNWEEYSQTEKAYVIIHELVHIQQFAKLTWFGFLWVYLFPFPFIFCYGRYWLEARAYEEEFKYRMRYEGSDFHALADYFAKAITGSTYLGGWAFKAYAKKDMETRLFKLL